MRRLFSNNIFIRVLLLIGLSTVIDIRAFNPSITLLTISTPNRLSFSQYSLPVFKKYADQWGYELRICDHSLDDSRSLVWSKILFVLNVLHENSCDWVAWIDDDIFITNPAISIESFIQKYGQNSDFIIGQDPLPSNVPPEHLYVNTGLFLVKNSSWAKEFLQRVWDLGSEKFVLSWPAEQGVMCELMLSEYKDSHRIKRLPARELQSFMMTLKKNEQGYQGLWQPKDFCAHMAGELDCVREHYMRQLAQNSNVYPTLPGFCKAGWSLRKNDTSVPLTIAVVSISTPERESFSQYTLGSFKNYTNFWGYDFFVSHETLDSSRHVAWSKIKLVLDALKSGKFDWVAWFDDDIFITNPTIPLEQFIQEYGKTAHLIISGHKTAHTFFSDVNSGLFLIKASDWSIQFLQKVWDFALQEDKKKYLFDFPWEQSAIQALFSSEEYENSLYISKLPARKIQSFLTMHARDDKGDYGQWEPGDFAAHMAGGSHAARLIVFWQFGRSCNRYPTIPILFFNNFYTVRPPNQIHNDTRPSIVVVTMSTPLRTAFAQYSITCFQDYCNYWGYEFGVNYQQLMSDKEKMSVVLDLLNSNKYEWVVWVDDEIFITDMNIPLEQFIDEYGTGAHIIISQERSTCVDERISSSLFFIKNSAWSKEFLNTVLDRLDVRLVNNDMSFGRDKKVIDELIATKKYNDSGYIKRVDAGAIQSFFDPTGQDAHAWLPKKFAIDLSKCTHACMAKVMFKLAKNPYEYPL